MKNNIIALTKTSAENEVKAYFEKVLELKKSGEEFPVDLELVWPLVYTRKDTAVKELKDNFVQGFDYKVFQQKPENLTGGRPTEDYLLSVSCMEYFIVRKVRPVFEVYRQVFHRVAEKQPVSSIDLFELALKSIKENQAEVQELKKEVSYIKDDFKVLEQKVTSPRYFTIEQYCRLYKIDVNYKQELAWGEKATFLSKQMGYPIGKVRHKYWTVNTYAEIVLDTLRKMEIEDTLFD